MPTIATGVQSELEWTAHYKTLKHYLRWLQLGSGGTKRITWSDRGINFQAEDPFITEDGNGIGVTIAAWTGTGQNKVYLPVDNPYQFFNPPLGIVTGYYGDGTPIVDTSETIAAAKAIVYDAVILRAQELGWNPP